MSLSKMKDTNHTIQLIDVEKVIGSKNPKILKAIPGFIIRYIKRIIHQEETNQFLLDNRDNFSIDFLKAILKRLNITFEVKGVEHFDKNKRYIFASNHPLGGLDGTALMIAISNYFSGIKFPVNDILMSITNLKPLFIPINKHGGHSKDAAIAINEAYESDDQILIFPAGLVSRKIGGEIIDLEWKNSFVKKAISYERDIIPVHISGQNSNFFYNLANFRKKLGIKANIEMLFLVDEVYKNENSKITITFGTPISHNDLKEKGSPRQWAQKIKEKAYSLSKID